MDKNKAEKICSDAKDRLDLIINNALSGITQASEGEGTINDFSNILKNCGGYHITSTLNPAQKHYSDMYSSVIGDLKKSLKSVSVSITEALEIEISKDKNAENILLFIDTLEQMEKNVESLSSRVKLYKNAKSSDKKKINDMLAGCKGIIAHTAKEWRKKADNTPDIRKKFLELYLKKNQQELERSRNLLRDKKNELEACKAEMTGVAESYSDEISKAIGKAREKYAEMLKNIEKTQVELNELSKARMEAAEAFARASVFSKSEKEAVFKEVEAKYRALISEVNEQNGKAVSLVGYELPVTCENIGDFEQRFEKLDGIYDDIERCNTAIDSYKAAIEGIKGELDGQ